MAKFEAGQRVIVLDNGIVRKGEIENTYSTLDIAIVKMDDGEIRKVPFASMGVELEAPVQSEEPVEEAPQEQEENPTITISEDEFKKKVIKIVVDESKKLGESGFMIGLIMTTVIAKIARALFHD